MYFSLVGRKGIGLLIPGGILFVAGVVSQIATLFDSWDKMWPGFILAVAAGLFEFYWFGSRNKWLLIPINILTVLSLLFFVVFSIGPVLNHLSVVQPVIAVLLVLGGAWLILGQKKQS
ncbi:membrane protein [Paenibacillus sp. JCM 10914]|nr:membrane protein [Paenibacillus sp. JCM 10914]